MPDTCVRCNAPANGYTLKRTLQWHSPLWYLLILVSILIYIIVALCIRKKATLHVGLCELHRRRRIAFIAGGWLGSLAGIGLIVVGAAINNSGMAVIIGLFLTITAAVAGILGSAVVSAAKIEKDLVWVKGAGPAFLEHLPEYTGPR